MIRPSRIRTLLISLVLGLAFILPGLNLTPAHAATDYASFVGAWHNVNSGTEGITRLNIIAYRPTIDQVYVYGKCYPTDCAWGRATFISDGSPTLSATYYFSFATKSIWVWRDGSFLRVYSYTHFIDNSGRKDYTSEDIFER
jgi:hypothetical protein